MQPLVIYHANCADGHCAAWLMHRVYPDAEYRATNYGDKPPIDLFCDRDVYILDFSFPRPDMEVIIGRAKKVICLDHHKTAEAALAGLKASNTTIAFDMNKSGARLTWEYLNPGETSPWLVDYTEDRDLWKWKLDQSKEINAALRSFPMDFEMWDYIHTDYHVGDMYIEGCAILRAQQQEVDRHVANAVEMEFEGHKVLCVNATTLMSEIGEALAKDRPFGVTWFKNGKTGDRIFSLRSRGDKGMDVSEIAKRHGGGGHKQAAGFQVPSSLGFPI